MYQKTVQHNAHQHYQNLHFVSLFIRSAFSAHMSSHPDPEIRANAAILQTHSQSVHDQIYRRDKTKLAAAQSGATDQALENADDEFPELEGTEVQKKQKKRKASKGDQAEQPAKRIRIDDKYPEDFAKFSSANGANRVFNDIQIELLRQVFEDGRRDIHSIREKASLDERFGLMWAELVQKRKNEKEAARTLRRSLDWFDI